MDLESFPDLVLLEMYKYFNIGKLRLNRKMKERIEAFLFNKIHLKVHKNEYYMTVSNTWINEKKFDNESIDRLAEGLRAWSATYSARQIEIEMLNIASYEWDTISKRSFVGPAIEALMEFNTDMLIVHGTEFIEERDKFLRNYTRRLEVHFPHPSFPTLLVMAANATEVNMDNLRCSELKAIDLTSLHRNLINGGCKMSSFSAKVNPQIGNEFLKLCFGVVVQEDPHPNCYSKEYQFMNEPVSIYSNDRFPTNEIILTGNWRTELNQNIIKIEKMSHGEKSTALKGLYEIELFNRYEKFTEAYLNIQRI